MATKSGEIPSYEATAVDAITSHVETLRKTFRSTKTKNLDFRLEQIRKLYWAISDNAALLEDAVYQDIRKPRYEASLQEIGWCLQECLIMSENLKKWAKDEPIVGSPLHFSLFGPRIRSEPFGSVLVIGAYNYPIQLNLVPVIGAMAAGNTVVLKPSELAPCTAMVLKKIFDEYLDPECYVCVNGALEQSKHLLSLKFDKITFTGGKRTGTIVALKAAETLTPTLLELGGLNPAFVTKNANLDLAARRLLWQKTINAGQVCMSHNYVLVERSVVDSFIASLHKSYSTFFPNGAKQSPDLSRIINGAQFHRMKKMLDTTRGKIVMGGSMDEDDLFIEPTAVLVSDVDDSMMVEESFGPIWSILPFDTLDEAIDIANNVDPTPLALYTFGSDKENDKVALHVTSGAVDYNDGLCHGSTNAVPLGGVGGSGTGFYHGFYSFKAFSHQRPVIKVPYWADKLLRVRYMPYSDSELSRFRAMSYKKPNFDRSGKISKGVGYWVSLLFGLGAKSGAGAVVRWGLVILIASVLKLRRNSLGL